MYLRHASLAATTATLAVLTLTACNAGAALTGSSSDDASAGGSATGSSEQAAEAPKVTLNIPGDASAVPVDRTVKVAASAGRLTKVEVASEDGRLAGEMADDGAAWTSADGLEPGTTYTVRTVASGSDGTVVRDTSQFTTVPLSLAQQTYPSVAPLQGETVGVGMPVIVSFDVAVTDRASFERHMTVNSAPSQPGSWYWLSDNEAHWRPKSYWKAGTEVQVDVDINGVSAGNGIYGQEDRQIDFTVGDANIIKVDAASYEMKVFSNGKLLRTLPTTTGKAGFTTRSGTKVIMEKFASKRMNSETVGIPAGSSEAYDIDNVQYAMRVTNSGEFIHAAPWSVGSQGYANVSHGCTGLSTDNAGWLYSLAKRGDVVEYTGTDRGMEPGNGWTDWELSFAEYKQGSALS